MNAATFLWRQVNPWHIKENRITSELFLPTRAEGGKSSVYDGDQISAKESWEHYNAPDPEGSKASLGVMALTVEECQMEGVEPVPDPTPFPEHVLLDFTGLSNRKQETAAKALRSIAVDRGWIYRSDDPDDPDDVDESTGH